ncbi:MAG: ParA family protein, partial [Deltaproteobacteria bacterium]|nr:ParA family protein [Deltaproteobacteria bacterium]
MPPTKPRPAPRQDVPGRPGTSPPHAPRILAFAGQKGGAGKTTSAIATACEWQARGRRVLLVDTDPQGSARTWADVAGELGTTIPTVVAMGSGLHRPGQLPALAAQYDVTVVDCPPRLDDVQRAVLMVAHVVVIPCGPSTLDTWAIADSLDLVRKAQQLRPELLARVCITRKQPGTVVG